MHMAVTASVPNNEVKAASPVEFERPHASRPCRLTVLGATGSVGTSTLDLVARAPERFEVVALTAQSNAPALAALARLHRAKLAVIGDEKYLPQLRDELAGTGIRTAGGADALVEAALMPADCVMADVRSGLLRKTRRARQQGMSRLRWARFHRRDQTQRRRASSRRQRTFRRLPGADRRGARIDRKDRADRFRRSLPHVDA